MIQVVGLRQRTDMSIAVRQHQDRLLYGSGDLMRNPPPRIVGTKTEIEAEKLGPDKRTHLILGTNLALARNLDEVFKNTRLGCIGALVLPFYFIDCQRPL